MLKLAWLHQKKFEGLTSQGSWFEGQTSNHQSIVSKNFATKGCVEDPSSWKWFLWPRPWVCKRFKVHNFVAPCLIILFLYMTCVGQRSQVHLCVRSRWLIFVILRRTPREQRKGESSISWLMACLVNLCFITKKCRQQQDPHTYLARCRCCATFALTKLLWLPGNISFPLAEIWVFLATADRSQWLQAQRILLRFGNSMHGRSQCLCDELNLPFRRRGVKVMLLQSAIGMVEKWALECRGSFGTCAEIPEMAESFDCSPMLTQI